MDAEDRFKITLCLGVVGLDLIGLSASGLAFDWSSTAKVWLTWPFLMLIAWYYTAQRPEPGFATALRETAHLVFFSAAAAVLSYLAAGLNRPLIDNWLVEVDRLIGFDWIAYVSAVNERPWLGNLTSLVYVSTLPQVALAAILLPLIGRLRECRELVLGVMIAALLAIGISAVLPSAGALATFRPDESFLNANWPVVDLAYKEAFFQMRAHALQSLSLEDAKGLIAFPSYHVALSTLIVLAFRRMPAIFWPLLTLNLAVTLATPVDGGHHMVDAFGGAAVGLLAFAFSVRLRKLISRFEVNSALDQPKIPTGSAKISNERSRLLRPAPLES